MTIYIDQGDKDLWVSEARDLLRPIIDTANITDDYTASFKEGKEAESIKDIMRILRELWDHLDTDMGEVCECSDSRCPAWQYGYNKGQEESLYLGKETL